MPCYDSYVNFDNYDSYLAYLKESWIHNSPVSEMLCAIMKELEKLEMLEIATPETLAWWEAHKQRDKARAP